MQEVHPISIINWKLVQWGNLKPNEKLVYVVSVLYDNLENDIRSAEFSKYFDFEIAVTGTHFVGIWFTKKEPLDVEFEDI